MSSTTFSELQKHFFGSRSVPGFDSGTDSEHATQKFFEDVVHLGLSFKAQDQVKQKDEVKIPATKEFLSMPEGGMTYEQLMDSWQTIAKSSANWSSPNFMGFPDAANAIAALGAAILVPLLNQNLANQDICAPSATFIEMEVIHWLREQLGFPVPESYSAAREIGGCLTLGGCLSNTISLMAAREHLFPGSGMRGLPVEAALIRVLVPDVIEHYSIRSAMAWLSMGEANVVRIPVDDYFRMDRDALEKCITDLRAQGYYVLACVAYAGDSRSMRIDDFEEIGKCLRRANVWFHIDACHGSQLAFSRKHRHKLNGVSKADSITIDPHKVLWIPYTCSFVLFKDPTSLSNISTNSDLILKTQWSLGQITPCIGSKAFDALKLWSVIKFFGKSGIETLIDERLALTVMVQEEIKKRPDLILLNETDINSCMFMFLPEKCQKSRISTTDLLKINQCNLFIKTTVNQVGESYVHGFNLNRCPHPLLPDKSQTYVLRTMNGNPLTDITHVGRLLDQVVSLGTQHMLDEGYQFHGEGFQLERLDVGQKLSAMLSHFFGSVPHCALVYGSSVSRNNRILSDIDIMIIASDDFCTPENKAKLEKLLVDLYVEERIALDAEVPYEKKLLIPISFAESAANMVPFFSRTTIPTIEKTPEHLKSDEMISRLVLNVLTVPNLKISGDEKVVARAKSSCEEVLVRVITRLRGGAVATAEEFAAAASGDGVRSGEEYLGYKDRPETQAHLRTIFGRHLNATSSPALNDCNPSTSHPEAERGVEGSSSKSSSADRDQSSSARGEEESATSQNDSEDITETRIGLGQSSLEVKGGASISVQPHVLFINGFPGVGKLTIAKIIQKMITDSRLVDNHILIDPVEAIFPGRNEVHHRLRKEIRRVAFDAIKKELDSNSTVIMTSCTANLPKDMDVFAEHADIARARRVPLIYVNMTCDEAVNLARLQSTERVEANKTKMTEGDVLVSLRKKFRLLKPDDVAEEIKDVKIHYLELDTSDLSASAAAEAVVKFVSSQDGED